MKLNSERQIKDIKKATFEDLCSGNFWFYKVDTCIKCGTKESKLMKVWDGLQCSMCGNVTKEQKSLI